ncbi:MAG TPA: RDD family protein [Solirubrobacteraceae bacterium]|nr:RDD family protein [Solirubrobacteraceae bacterium]
MEYEDRITIWAPEGIELDYTLAGLGSRFIAASVDTVIRIAVLGALIGVLAALGASPTALLIVLIVGTFLALFAYDVAFEVWAGGRTPGKRWSGLRVLMTSGQPVSFAPSAVRNLMRIVDEWATAFIPGTISILVTKRCQRLGDLAAGTIVIRERGAGTPALATAELRNLRPELDVTAVSASELAAIRDFLSRREKLTAESRARVAGVLAERVAGKVGGLTEGQLSPEQLLETVAAAKAAAAG